MAKDATSNQPATAFPADPNTATVQEVRDQLGKRIEELEGELKHERKRIAEMELTLADMQSTPPAFRTVPPKQPGMKQWSVSVEAGPTAPDALDVWEFDKPGAIAAYVATLALDSSKYKFKVELVSEK